MYIGGEKLLKRSWKRDKMGYLIYNEWEVIHSDPCGLEARQDPNEPGGYGINRIVRKGEKVVPMFLLPRGSLQNISLESILRGNELILNKTVSNEIQQKEYRKFIQGGTGFGAGDINAFIKATYIQLAREGKIMI